MLRTGLLTTDTSLTPRDRSPARAIEASTTSARLRMLVSYGRAWAQADEGEMRSLVGECWSASGRYVNPFVDPVLGVDGLVRLILDYRVLFPEIRIGSVGRPLIHHDYASWRWSLSSSVPIRICGTNFGTVLTGLDIIQFGDDQRIASVVAFFDE